MAAEPTTEAGLAQALEREQARHIHRNLPTGVIGGYFVACLLVTAFWPVGNKWGMALWLAAGALLNIWRLLKWRTHRGGAFTLAQSRRWLHQATWGAGLSGCIWGYGALIFFAPADFVYHLVFVYAVAMMGVTAMFSFAAYPPTFRAFFLPATVPAVLGMAVQGSWLHFEVATGVAIFVAVTLRFFSNFSGMFIRSVELRFENQALVSELTVQKEAAESANLAKSRFLAAASHDLRQPMHALTLYLAAMDGKELHDKTRTNLANARQCAQTMDEMFRALLGISRLDAGAVMAEMRPFPLGPLLERLRIEFEPQAQAKGLSLRVRACERAVHGDSELVERILRNLITNAIRYTARGRILVGCRWSQGGRGEHGADGGTGNGKRALRIAVYDTGSGIAPQEQKQIFEEFYQVGNPERDRNKGIGLGLAIVERLARLMNAPVAMRSQVGRGSMFSVELRQASKDELLAAAVALANAGVDGNRFLRAADAGTPADFSGLLIVVVDDEEAILAATRQVLEKWGCQVLTAPSGATALAALVESRAPDALICDYRLREHETGIDVIDILRAEFNADIPALLVSGDSAPARMREAQASGLQVLHKPFDEEVLRQALTGILAARAQAQAAEAIVQ